MRADRWDTVAASPARQAGPDVPAVAAREKAPIPQHDKGGSDGAAKCTD